MKYIQKLVIISLLAALFLPFPAQAASSGISTSCQSIVTQGYRSYDIAVKNADKTFNNTVRNAEKTYKDSVRSGMDKMEAKQVLKQTITAAFYDRKQAVYSATTTLDSVIEDRVIECIKGTQSIPDKTQVTRFCSTLVSSYTNNHLKELSTLSRLFPKTYPSTEELSQFKRDNKDEVKVWKDLKKSSKALCEDFYSRYFQGDSSSSSNDSTNTSPDARRLADIRQLATAMELYYNDNNVYPASLQILAPTYLSAIPVAPKKSGSKCSAKQNTYTYTKLSDSTYTLSFCLSKKTSGLTAGVHVMSQAGIY